MKITGGTASGIPITVPRGIEVRPTGVRARKALFNSISSTLGFEGKKVVDFFAGSGALGLEAASLGADEVFFAEKIMKHCRIISENIEKVEKAGVSSKMTVIKADALSAVYKLQHQLPEPDIIFADPPYARFARYFKQFITSEEFAHYAENAVFIWEKPPRFNPYEDIEKSFWKVENIRKFAGTEFLYLRKPQA